jgi:carbon-monoxide dehydrogenase medium subunit
MLSNIHEIHRPTSVDEAVQLLRDGGGSLRAMAGGTAMSLFRSSELRGVVDLWSLPLREIRVDEEGLRLGATVTLGDLVRSEVAQGWAGGAVGEAAGSAASTPVRNLITVGGNLAVLYPWSSLPPVLLVLDARVAIAGDAGPAARVEELVARHPSHTLGGDSLLTEIVVPRCPPRAAATYLKFGESAVSYSWLDVAAFVEMDGATCRRCRLAVGAVEPRCRRLHAVESAVAGAELDETAARSAGELAAVEVDPIHDSRFSREYRLQLVRVQVARALLEARDRAENAEVAP